jgi:hypothetical protein
LSELSTLREAAATAAAVAGSRERLVVRRFLLARAFDSLTSPEAVLAPVAFKGATGDLLKVTHAWPNFTGEL